MTLTKNGTSVSLDVLYAPKLRIEHRQTLGETEGGTPKVYNYAVDVYYSDCTFRVADASTRSDLRDFITTTIQFAQETFTLTPDSGHDVGNGAGGAITAYLWESNLEEKMEAWQKFPMTLTFRKA